MHPDWLRSLPLSSHSLLDVHSAFTDQRLDFKVPLVIDGADRLVPISDIVRHDIPTLLLQAIKGIVHLARVLPEADLGCKKMHEALCRKAMGQVHIIAACGMESRARGLYVKAQEPAVNTQMQLKVRLRLP